MTSPTRKSPHRHRLRLLTAALASAANACAIGAASAPTGAAAGDSVGTVTINGNYTTSPGTTQQIELNAFGVTPGVNNDLIIVNGDVILNGGTVSIVNSTRGDSRSGGGFINGGEYTFLQYYGFRTGTFAGITTNSAFLTANLVYAPNSIGFILSRTSIRFRDIAQTSDQQHLATYLDVNINPPRGDSITVLDQLLLLDAASARSALDQMSGAIYGSATQANFQNLTLMYAMLARQVGEALRLVSPIEGDDTAEDDSITRGIGFSGQSPDGTNTAIPAPSGPLRPTWNAWTTSYGSSNGSNDTIGRYGAGGTMLSVYQDLDDANTAGIFGAYNYVRLQSITPAVQRVQQNNGQFGAYIRSNIGAGYLLGAGSIGFDHYDSGRQIRFGDLNRAASGDYGGWQYSGYLECGRDVQIRSFHVGPFGALQYAHSRQDAFTETGAVAVDLNVVNGIDAVSLRTIAGARGLWETYNRGGKWIRPELRAAWIHEYLDGATTFNSVFAGVGGTNFATQGADFGRDWGLFGGGLNFSLANRVLLAGNYDLQVNDRAVFHLASATMQVRW